MRAVDGPSGCSTVHHFCGSFLALIDFCLGWRGQFIDWLGTFIGGSLKDHGEFSLCECNFSRVRERDAVGGLAVHLGKHKCLFPEKPDEYLLITLKNSLKFSNRTNNMPWIDLHSLKKCLINSKIKKKHFNYGDSRILLDQTVLILDICWVTDSLARLAFRLQAWSCSFQGSCVPEWVPTLRTALVWQLKVRMQYFPCCHQSTELLSKWRIIWIQIEFINNEKSRRKGSAKTRTRLLMSDRRAACELSFPELF